MKQRYNLIKMIERNANTFPDKIAFVEVVKGKEDKKISYLDLYNRVTELGDSFSASGLSGKLCALFFSAGIDSIVALLACFYAGVIPIIRTFSPVISSERFRLQIDSLLSEENKVYGVISVAHILKLIGKQYEKRLKFIDINNKSEIFSPSIEESRFMENTDLIQLTSGSTTSSKWVKISFDNLVSNIHYCMELWQVNSDSITVSWAPHSHIFGLMTGILLPLYSGSKSIIMQPSDFSKDPLFWIECISKFRATHSGAPNFAYEMCTSSYSHERMESIDLSSWQVATNGGELTKSTTITDFHNMFNKHGFNYDKFCPTYGMTENSGIVCSVSSHEPVITCIVDRNELINNRIVELKQSTNINACTLISVGRPLPEVDILIVDTDTLSLLPDCQVGEILISSPALTQGYMENIDDSSFVKRIGSNGKTKMFFRTGDIGFMKLGSMFIIGRLKEAIIIKGKNYSPFDIELYSKQIEISEHLGLNAAFSVATDSQEAVILFQEVIGELSIKKQNEVRKQIMKRVRFSLNIDIHEVVFLKEGDIPKTASGKIKRVECKKQYLKDIQHMENSDNIFNTKILNA